MTLEKAVRRMQAAESPVYSPEVAAAIQRLETLRDKGWNLTELTVGELDAAEADVDVIVQGRSSRERDIDSYSSQLLGRAREALKTERTRRNLEHQSIVREQVSRVDHIARAAGYLERAVDEMGYAEDVEDKRYLIAPRPVDEIAVESLRAMDDAALRGLAFTESMAEKQTGIELDRNEHSATVLEKHGGTRGKRLAKVLRAMAQESREALEAHRANIASIRGEQDARVERAKMERKAKESMPETVATVDDLLARVAELEQIVAAGTVETTA